MPLRRRTLVFLLGSAAARPSCAWSQVSGTPTIGFLSSRSADDSASLVSAFRAGLGEAGFVEGRNLAIAFRWAEGSYDRLLRQAAELVGLRVSVLFAGGGPPAALAAKAATATIPIVFSSVSDPVELGLVGSLGRPGANVTGMSSFSTLLGAKCLELLKDLAPAVRRVGYLTNPASRAAEASSREALASAAALGIQLIVLPASTDEDLEKVLSIAANPRVDGIVVPAEPFFDSRREKIVALAARYALTAVYPWREYALAGGLMSYGGSLPDNYRQAGTYVGRILKGEKPADLPVMQPSRFQLVLNLRTAKTLGLDIPSRMLERADELVE